MRRAAKVFGLLKEAGAKNLICREAHSANEVAPVTAPANFWSQHKIQDLENSSVELELARRHNSSFPYYKNQLIVGEIVRVDRDHVAVHTGHRSVTAFAKKELHLSQLVKSKDRGMRSGPRDFKVGDVMHFVLEELQTPFGDMSLRINKTSENEKHRLVWAELEEASKNRTVVKGRILNGMNGGYAVGIAGFVGFLPHALCTILTASKVGVLQDMLIQSVDAKMNNFVVLDYAMYKQRLDRDEQFRQRQEDRLKKLKKQLQDAEDKFGLEEGTGVLDIGMTGAQIRALLDIIAIWRIEDRLASMPQVVPASPGYPFKHQEPMDTTPLDRLQRTLTKPLQARTPVVEVEDILPVIERLQGTVVDSAYHVIMEKVHSWGLLNPKPKNRRARREKLSK